MLQLGSEPEALTDGLRQTLLELRDRLQPGDVLRMLRLLGEAETALRRSANPRLAIESLLLRWCMLDRMVELARVLAGERSAPAEARSEAREPGRAPPESWTAPAYPRPSGGEAVSLEAIVSAWPAIASEVRDRSRFLGEALGATSPIALEPPWLTVWLGEPNPLFAEKLRSQASLVEEVLQRATGQSLRLRVTEAPVGADPASSKPRTLSEASIKADRLRTLRAKDPALDTAADSLDLEIVE